jgi:hypothetical protein
MIYHTRKKKIHTHGGCFQEEKMSGSGEILKLKVR